MRPRTAPMSQRLVRSYLYVPADAGERLNKASSRGADAIIADLEDSVAVNRKGVAAENAAEWLAPPPGSANVERWVRVNQGGRGLDDLAAVFGPGLTGVCLPKVSSGSEVRRVSEALDALERHRGISGQATLIMPLIESAVGLQSLSEIAGAPRVQKLQIGELDLAADLGLQPGDNEAELGPLRSRVVVASVASGLLPPVGAVSPEFRDADSLAISTQRLKRAGFIGRAAIHPAQLDTIHRCFAVTPTEFATALALVHRYETAVNAGAGVILGDDGRMVDEAVVRQSRRTIALAAAAERGDFR
jgi:citrate lyase subunit beta/citryl-CoA lyase